MFTLPTSAFIKSSFLFYKLYVLNLYVHLFEEIFHLQDEGHNEQKNFPLMMRYEFINAEK